ARASTPLPHPASTIRPRGGRCATRWGATSREKSLRPASWICARSAEYITGIIRAAVARSDGVVPVADSRRYRLRAVRLREETRPLAATRRRPRADGLPVFHTHGGVARRRRDGDLRRCVAARARRLVIAATRCGAQATD